MQVGCGYVLEGRRESKTDLNWAKDCIKINYYKRMFSKVISRAGQFQSLASMQQRAFRASVAANAGSSKPSIGDAVTILQSKVSGINQVVSVKTRRSCGFHLRITQKTQLRC